MDPQTINILRTLVATAAPLVIAAMGETITERAGVINLSLDGSLVLTAMTAFGVSFLSGSPILGLAAAFIVGALLALIIAFSSITLRLDQVAVGFVLTLLAADLAEFLGMPIAGKPPTDATMPYLPIPILSDIPIIGHILFNHDVLVYFSFVLVFLVWFFLFRTRPGLNLRAIGEHPEAAFARGTQVNRLRYFYTVLGGGIIGIAGAAYTLSVEPGWSTPPGMLGDGWIALAIVIFGGWHPVRVMLGAYLFAALRALATGAQGTGLSIPVPILNMLPWILMILTLLIVSGGLIERLLRVLPAGWQNRMRGFLRSQPPAAIGTRFDPE